MKFPVESTEIIKRAARCYSPCAHALGSEGWLMSTERVRSKKFLLVCFFSAIFSAALHRGEFLRYASVEPRAASIITN